MTTRRILAIGGGGFLMEDALSPIDDFILELTGKSRPKICFIPTPAGDRDMFLAKFYAAFTHSKRSCAPSHLTVFSPINTGSVPRDQIEEHLLEQDAVFVSGGNTRAALAIWREFGIDSALKNAWAHGVLLSGMSAGAICWFEHGHTDSNGPELATLKGLGFLKGLCTPHYQGEAKRRPAMHRAIASGEFESGLAIDDYAAVLFEEQTICEAVSWRERSNAYRVTRDIDGNAIESPASAIVRKLT